MYLLLYSNHYETVTTQSVQRVSPAKAQSEGFPTENALKSLCRDELLIGNINTRFKQTMNMGKHRNTEKQSSFRIVFLFLCRFWVGLNLSIVSDGECPSTFTAKHRPQLIQSIKIKENCTVCYKKNAELEVISNWAESESIPQAVRLANIVIEYECKTTPDLS